MSLVPFPKHNNTICRNPAAAIAAESGLHQRGILDAEGFANAWNAIRGWPGYGATPLRSLPGLAKAVGVGEIWFKDESSRFGLKSFKALGGGYAVLQRVVREITHATGAQPTSSEVFSGRYGSLVATRTVTCATDGNHGRSVAWAARLVGCQCVIFVHEGVTAARRAAIEALGATVEVLPGTYDDAVRHAAKKAKLHDWWLVSDTSYDGYVDVPRDVMQGYRVMVEEAVLALPEGRIPTHTFVQVGVGALAAAVCAHLWEKWGAGRPRFLTVESDNAACLQRSIAAGRPTPVAGNLDTLMAGLACGEVSILAWKILRSGVDAALTVSDEQVIACMRILARGTDGDPPITSGESGAAGLAGLLTSLNDRHIGDLAGLQRDSRVLLFGTEGATDEGLYRSLIGAGDTAFAASTAGPTPRDQLTDESPPSATKVVPT
jgi:diaminopropionate ammonia-lyase